MHWYLCFLLLSFWWLRKGSQIQEMETKIPRRVVLNYRNLARWLLHRHGHRWLWIFILQGQTAGIPLTIEKFFLFEATMPLEVALYLFNGIFVLAFLYFPHINILNNMFNICHCLLGIGLALTAGLFRYSFILKGFMFSYFFKQVGITMFVLCTNWVGCTSHLSLSYAQVCLTKF